jgi:hypothetical protein
MRVSKLQLLAAAAVAAGVAGCSLPEVLPMASGTSQGPSPYGVWYEQHWATNAVLLAAADQPEVQQSTNEEAEVDKALADYDAADQAAKNTPPPVEASAETTPHTEEFSNSSPYQFPSSQFAPQAQQPPAEELTPPAPPPAPEKPATVPSGPIRY